MASRLISLVPQVSLAADSVKMKRKCSPQVLCVASNRKQGTKDRFRAALENFLEPVYVCT